MFANNAGSDINGANLTLTSGITNAPAATAQNGGLINLTGGSVNTTVGGAIGLFGSSGRIVASGLTITTTSVNPSQDGARATGTVGAPGSIQISNSTITTGGGTAPGLDARGATAGQDSLSTVQADTVSITTTGPGSPGLAAMNGTVIANSVTVQTSGGSNSHGVFAGNNTPNTASAATGQVTITGTSSIGTTGSTSNALRASGVGHIDQQ